MYSCQIVNNLFMQANTKLRTNNGKKKVQLWSNKCLTLARESASFGLEFFDISHVFSSQIVNNLFLLASPKSFAP